MTATDSHQGRSATPRATLPLKIAAAPMAALPLKIAAASLVTASIALFMAGSADAGGRVALLVADDLGVGADAPLRYTRDDARRVGEALVDVGRFEGRDVHTLIGPDASQVLDKLDALSQGKPDLFVFYYSGHADAGALRLAGTRLPLDVLLARLSRMPARLRLGVLDACQSGAAARGRAKGVTGQEPFKVRVSPDMASGQVVIASSAEDESSFESETHRGAVFTSHWVTGLRGAADADADAAVSLGEAYSYAYARTVNATLLSREGPQHPTVRLDLAGRRDPPLTFLDTSSALTLSAERDALYLILDGAERRLLAELTLLKGDSRRIALPPGDYVVKRRSPDALHLAQLRLGRDDDRRLYDHQMREVPLVRLATKGALGDRWLSASLGQHLDQLGALGLAHGALGVEWEREGWLLDADLTLSTGVESFNDLDTRLSHAGLTFGALWTLRLGDVALRAGPAAGALIITQDPEARPTRAALAGLLGARTRLDLSLAPGLGLFVQIDALALLTRVEPPEEPTGLDLPADLTALGRLSYQLGLRVSF